MAPPFGPDIEPQPVAQVQQVAHDVCAFLRCITFLNLSDRDEPRLLAVFEDMPTEALRTLLLKQRRAFQLAMTHMQQVLHRLFLTSCKVLIERSTATRSIEDLHCNSGSCDRLCCRARQSTAECRCRLSRTTFPSCFQAPAHKGAPRMSRNIFGNSASHIDGDVCFDITSG